MGVSTREEKSLIIKEMTERFKQAKAAVLTDYKGLNVAEATKLRRRFRKSDCEFKVAKNTLVRLAAKQAGVEGLDSYLEGPTAIAFSEHDPVAPAKVLFEFIREFKKMEIKAGVLEGRVIDAVVVRKLADLPSREVLLTKVAGGMQAPLYGLVNVLYGTLCSFVYALESLRKQRASEA
jgi:large subunit ribosomal protein L10